MALLLEKDQIGKREQLLDVLVYADMRKTYLFSSIQKSKELTNTYFEWLLDKYEDSNPGDHVIVDGTDVSSFGNHAEGRARIGTYITNMRKTYKVSPLAENVSVIPGISSEEAEAKRKMAVELARLVEKHLLSDQENVVDDGAVGYQGRALGKWIQATAQSANVVPEAHRPTSGQIRTTAAASLSEENDIQEVLQAVYDATGADGDLTFLAGSEMRRALTSSTRLRTGDTNNYYTVRNFNQASGEKKITSTTQVYEGDFGMVRVVVSPFIGWTASGDTGSADTDRAYFLDMSKLKLRYQSLPNIITLEDRGGGTPIVGTTCFGLQCTTPRGMGKIVPT